MRKVLLFFLSGLFLGCSGVANRKMIQLPLQMVLTSSAERFNLGGMEFSSREDIVAEITDVHKRTGRNLELVCFVLSESDWQHVVTFLNELNERGFVTIIVEKDISMIEIAKPISLDDARRLDKEEECE